jgi:hypothetical protein
MINSRNSSWNNRVVNNLRKGLSAMNYHMIRSDSTYFLRAHHVVDITVILEYNRLEMCVGDRIVLKNISCPSPVDFDMRHYSNGLTQRTYSAISCFTFAKSPTPTNKCNKLTYVVAFGTKLLSFICWNTSRLPRTSKEPRKPRSQTRSN